LLDSSDITYREWCEIGRVIRDRYDDFDGFVVLHGTDTMAYTASAMSFMLEGLDKAVVFTGSQIPLCRMRSDGIDNLVTSILVAASGEVREVCLYFGGELMRGNRVTKVSADGLHAFASPNYPKLAEIGTSIVYRRKFLRQRAESDFRLFELSDVPIAVIKMFPGISPKLFEVLIASGVKAIVIEAFGAGNIPSGESLAAVLRLAKEKGVVIVVTSQCGHGNVELGTYATSRELLSAGAVSGHDMTTEAAVTKLYYLFSKYGSTDTVKNMLSVSISGELSVGE
ncbi:MAG: asparaginase, partial [Clostridia bacterium]|nr:asparaginase [Clostridia bacterium]